MPYELEGTLCSVHPCRCLDFSLLRRSGSASENARTESSSLLSAWIYVERVSCRPHAEALFERDRMARNFEVDSLLSMATRLKPLGNIRRGQSPLIRELGFGASTPGVRNISNQQFWEAILHHQRSPPALQFLRMMALTFIGL
jgi:hypothetical protein